jgi:hypothetical protein
MQRQGDRLRAILVLLLVSSAVLFAAGAAVERHHDEGGTPAVQETHAEGGSSEEGSSEEGGQTGEAPAVGSSAEVSSEKLLGIDPEAPWVVVTGVALSIALAVGIWVLRRRMILGLAIAFGLVLAALDVRELVHQLQESRPSLIAVASILAVPHVLVAATAVLLLRSATRPEAVA